METAPSSYLVFVDFENVSEIDLGPIKGKPVHVILLIGKNQSKIDVALVEQIQQFSTQIELVRAGASGRNALDLILAYSLGRAAQTTPGSRFCIISRDKDFDPLISHLRSKHINVERYEDFFRLPCFDQSKTGIPTKSASHTVTPIGDRFDELIKSFTGGPQKRPKKRETLLRHISTFWGNKLSDVDVTAVLEKLETRGAVSIDAKGKVEYAAVK